MGRVGRSGLHRVRLLNHRFWTGRAASAIQGPGWGAGVLDTSAIRSERLRQVYAYWAAKIVGGRLPSRASIDPVEIPRLLPYIFLVDVERDPQRFRFRLVGTQVCAWAGRDTTGLYTDDPAYGLRGPELTRLYAEVVARRAPLCSERPGGRPEPGLVFYDEIVLPLSADGETVNMLFCAADMLVTTRAMHPGTSREIWGRSYGR